MNHTCTAYCRTWNGHVELIYLDESFTTPADAWEWRDELAATYGVDRIEGFELATEAPHQAGKTAFLLCFSS